MCTAERWYLSHIFVRLKKAVLVVDFVGTLLTLYAYCFITCIFECESCHSQPLHSAGPDGGLNSSSRDKKEVSLHT